MTEKNPIELWQHNFTNHTPSEESAKIIESFRETAKQFAEQILLQSPVSREQSLALTHLEEALFYANAAVARQDG